jgi:proteasome lid subunit RPN8/RPN11
MQLWMTPDISQTLAEYARKSQPNECCGIVLGVGNRVTQIMPVPNIAADSRNNYRMDDKVLVKILLWAEREQQKVVGFYHSHPRTEPIPSQSDIRLAAYPDAAYLIVGFRSGETHLAAWSIKRDRVEPIKIIVSREEPPPEPEPLSQTHKRAIILAACIAFAVLIVLSLSLLPPAPIITGH